MGARKKASMVNSQDSGLSEVAHALCYDYVTFEENHLNL
jgi:hypothetical protein